MVERCSVILILFLLTSCLPKAGEATLIIKNDSQPQFSEEFAVLSENVLGKCTDCHSSLKTEKGLQKMIGQGPWEESKFFLMVKDGIMPPGQPLSTQELEFITNYFGGELPEPEQDQEPEIHVTYADLVQKILPKCTTCHAGAKTEEGLMKWVDKHNPMASKLLRRTEDGSMPKGGTRLSPEELDLVRNYLMQFSDI